MLLAMDTATRILSVAVYDGQRVLAEKTLYTDNQHTVQLIPMLHLMLQEIERTVQEVQAVAVSQGPGSFSGLRVGMGAAKGLAMGCDVPLIGIPTLDIVAYSTPALSENMLAVVQAGRGRIIAGRYHWQENEWKHFQLAEITTWETIIPQLDQNIIINGEIDENGSRLLAEHRLNRLNPAWNVRRAGFLAELGWKKLQDGIITKPSEVNPIYLKEP